MPTTSYTLQTLRKGLEVLEALERSSGELTLTELAEQLQESPTIVFRLLRTLEETGYVQRDPRAKRYSLGLRLWEVGRKAVSRLGLLDTARPVLRQLAERTGETAYLSVVRGTDIVYLDVVEGAEPLRVYAEPGIRVPLYLTASGKAILAFRGADLFEEVVAAGLKRLTPATITNPAQLQERLEEIRRTGVSINREERRANISAAAAPVFDAAGECIAAVGVSGPSMRFAGERLQRTVGQVRDAAAEISARLGYRPGAARQPEAGGRAAGRGRPARGAARGSSSRAVRT